MHWQKTFTAIKLQTRVCQVRMLDGSVVKCDVSNLTSGQELLEYACKKAEVVETEYFGLVYLHPEDTKETWLQMQKFLGQQFRKDSYSVSLQVRFWLPRPSLVKEDITRYQIVLQLRERLLNGLIVCSKTVHAMLASYVAQAEFGDFDQGLDELLDELVVGPFQIEETFKKNLSIFHKKHKHLSATEADKQYLEHACKLPLYGTELYQAYDSEGKSIHLGVNFKGISIIQSSNVLSNILWSNILEIKKKKKGNQLLVDVRLLTKDDVYEEATLAFICESWTATKRVCRACKQQFMFFLSKNGFPNEAKEGASDSPKLPPRAETISSGICFVRVRSKTFASKLKKKEAKAIDIQLPHTEEDILTEMLKKSELEEEIGRASVSSQSPAKPPRKSKSSRSSTTGDSPEGEGKQRRRSSSTDKRKRSSTDGSEERKSRRSSSSRKSKNSSTEANDADADGRERKNSKSKRRRSSTSASTKEKNRNKHKSITEEDPSVIVADVRLLNGNVQDDSQVAPASDAGDGFSPPNGVTTSDRNEEDDSLNEVFQGDENLITDKAEGESSDKSGEEEATHGADDEEGSHIDTVGQPNDINGTNGELIDNADATDEEQFPSPPIDTSRPIPPPRSSPPASPSLIIPPPLALQENYMEPPTPGMPRFKPNPPPPTPTLLQQAALNASRDIEEESEGESDVYENQMTKEESAAIEDLDNANKDENHDNAEVQFPVTPPPTPCNSLPTTNGGGPLSEEVERQLEVSAEEDDDVSEVEVSTDEEESVIGDYSVNSSILSKAAPLAAAESEEEML